MTMPTLTEGALMLLAIILLGLLHWKVPRWRHVTGPLLGVATGGVFALLWLLGRASGGRAEIIKKTENPPPKAPEYLDAMQDALPDDHPAVTAPRRERMERNAARSNELNAASKRRDQSAREQLDRELADLLKD